MRSNSKTYLDTKLASNNSLPFFLQRRVQFREAFVNDEDPIGYSYAGSKNKREFPQQHPSGFQPASKELFPAERVSSMMKWGMIVSIGPGLSNLGNTCFLNSVLQCLTYTPPLANFLLSGEHGRKCRIEGFCLVCELERHFSISLSNRPDRPRVIQPTGTVGHLKWIAKHMRVGRQEDSHEFLRFMIEGMQCNFLALADATKLENRIKETTLIHQIFGGYLQSQVKCLTCQNLSNTFDPFLDLSLDVRQVDTIDKALKRFVHPERLSKANRYRCDHCGKLSDADKSLSIYNTPNVLTIHLKRFNMSPVGEMSKINKYVEFPTELDMSGFISGDKSMGNVFDLYAVLVHEGQACNSGHYHAFVKASNGIWYSMNDSSVNQVSLQTVLKQRAYILFYTRQIDDSKEKIDDTAIITKPELPIEVPPRELPSPPATPVPDDLTKCPTPMTETRIISNSMWYLTEIKSFKLEDFSSLCSRLCPTSRWFVKFLLPKSQ